ncbi:MAG: InlB B-repeat-containing protein, partial [Clostridia bacterium]|nr:InlB B-repeat-containing protein [Clostridia bacterium]
MMKKINTNPQRTKKMSVIAILLLMAIIITSFVMARLNGRSNQETQEFIESLIAENENNPESVKYLITDNCISRVYPETEVGTFVTNFSEGEEVKVYTNSECTEEVTDGFVVSGMYAKYVDNGRKYEISVLGDINEKASKTESGAVLVGDGKLNQIELTRDIRSCVDEEWKIDEEVEKKSGDVNCENQIDELSVNTIIDYIVFGNLNVDEVGLIAKPTVEVISGDLNENTVYTSNVKIKIIENEEDALKTVYKITGDSVQGYKIAVNGEEVDLTENDIYKITAYTYGKLENKSKREYVIINIDKTANYTMEYYLEGVDGEYSKVETSTKVEEGEIGQTVGIEQKEFTDYELDVDNVNGKLQGEVLEDGSLVLKAYYNRKSFTYTFEAGENITGITAQKVTSTDGQGTTPAEPASTVSVTAKWGEKININAVVATEPGYTITWKEWVNEEDTTDKIAEKQTQITVGKENKTYKPTATKTVIDYTIAYELNGGALPTGATNKTEYTVETESFTLNNPSKAGYEFKGWTGGTVNTQGQIDNTIPAGSTENVSTPTTTLTVNSESLGNRKYTANWEAITNTPYKVEHYKETLKTGEFTLAEEENKGGTTDTEATATPKTYEGFTYDSTNENEVKSGQITADGELVLKLYYTRNTYNLTIVAGDNIANISAEGEAIEAGAEGDSTVGRHQTTSTTTLKYKYEQEVTLGTTRENKAGYTYQNIIWESSDTDKIANSTETTNTQTATKEITMPA